MEFEDVMYWLPAVLLFIFFIIWKTSEVGIKFLITMLIYGIIFICSIIWCKYWLDKKFKKKEKNANPKNNKI